MSAQSLKCTETLECFAADIEMISDNDDDKQQEQPHDLQRKSSRREKAYHSSPAETKCIICVAVKKDTTGKIIPVQRISLKNVGDTVHLAEKRLTEFAKIHVGNQTKYQEAGERILLTLSTKSLFAADVGYRRMCYESFRSPKWKKGKTKDENTRDHESNTTSELLNLIEYLIVVKNEVYTLSQLREFFAEVQGVNADTLRSIDIKKMIENKLTNKVIFCKPTHGSSNTTEYVVSSDAQILHDAIHSINTGEGITNYIQLKNIAQSISTEIQSNTEIPWPPTPQVVIESAVPLNKTLYNTIAWIVSPNAHLDKDGIVKLSTSKG